MRLERVLVGLLLLMAVSTCAACGQSNSSATPTIAGPAHDLVCPTTITPSPLPTWARDGFSSGDHAGTLVLGINNLILGVVFGDPLRAPNVAGHGNKILWVARPVYTGSHQSSDPDLKIHATLNGTSTAVDRVIAGGPGPSLVNMPSAGCWTFNLSWSGRSDRLALLYR
jgi:hypothetical protein